MTYAVPMLYANFYLTRDFHSTQYEVVIADSETGVSISTGEKPAIGKWKELAEHIHGYD